MLKAVEKSDGEAGVFAYLLMLILTVKKEHKWEFIEALEASVEYREEIEETEEAEEAE